MEFSDQFNDRMRRFLWGNNIAGNRAVSSPRLNYPVMIQCRYYHEQQAEIPLACDEPVVTMLRSNNVFSISIPNRIVFPFYIEPYTARYASAEAVFNNIIGRSGNRLFKGIIETSSGSETYYGSQGVILDANFGLLLLVTSVYRKVSDRPWEFDHYNVYVSPTVFTTESKINNVIRKKMVAYFLQRGDTSFSFSNGEQFIIKSSTPAVSDNSEDTSINDFLRAHAREVLEQIVYDSRGLL